uniref:Integrase catalytic domain-containing protein n=1 Tax=Fagus sylvatica TaxID=28930 RepID=A0A2N9IBP1_FAGSY
MSPEIMKRYLRLPTAREIWTALAKAFYDGADESQLFALNQRAFSTKQVGRPLSTYYGDLIEIFQELDHRDKFVMKDPDDVIAYKKSVERLRVHIFLNGLDAEFEQIRGEILRRDPVLDLEETYAYVRRDSVRRAALNGEPEHSELSAMVARRVKYQQLQINPKPSGPLNHDHNQSSGSQNRSYEIGAARPERMCTHCGGTGHTKSRCYELIGYPEWWDSTKAPRKRNSKTNHHASVAVVEPSHASTSNPEKASSFIATSGNVGKAFHTSVSHSEWIIDSGATNHMTFDNNHIQSIKSSDQHVVSTADGTPSPVLGEGSISLTKNLNLDSVLIVPSLNHNLLSVAQITLTLNCVVIFWPNLCVFKDIRTRKTIGCGTRRGKLYYLDLMPASSNKLAQVFSANTPDKLQSSKIWLWHRRLGHASFGYLQKLFPQFFSQLTVSDFKCDICEMAKSHRVPFPISMNKSPVPFMVIHSDVWGPANTSSLSGARWFVSFIDDHTRMTWICLMKLKSEVSSLFQQFHKMIATQYQSNIQVIRSDNGGEFINKYLKQYLNSHGIVHQTTCPDTPQQNGVAERKNRHLLEVVRASLFGAHMPTSYWGEAVTAAAYLINRVPSSSLQFQTPFNVLHHTVSAPTIPNLPPKVFGCVAFVHLHKGLRTKLEPRALRCVFVGYALHQKGYRCYHPPSRKLYVTLDVVFHENDMYYSESSFQGENRDELQTLHHPLDNLETSGECPSDGITMNNMEECPSETGDGPEVFEDENQGQMEVQNQIEVPLVSHDVPANQLSSPTDSMPESHENSESEPHLKVLPNRVTRGKPKVSYEPVLNSKSKYPINNYVSYHRLSKESMAFVNQLSVISIPNSVQEALKDPRWKEAMSEEMKALQKNSTWEVVDLPEGKIPVGCRWVFTIKYKADGTIERCKARLVAKGYTQTYGIDYTETFAPVAKINTVRILLSLAVNLDWPLHQFDVKNAFLHGNLQEEVYMELPPGCNLQTEGNKQVCRLRKSLYGLKQSPRAWFGRFTSFMKSIGYKQSNSDHTLFLKHNEEQITALIVYVDDMIVTGNDLEERKTLQEHLAREFEMKDLGELKYFLGIEVSRSKKGIFLSQRKYALDLLNETGMTACSPASTPMEENLKLCVHPNQVPANKERYQRLVGRLMYLAHTRPDLAYVLSVVSQFMHSPSEEHMNAVIRILRYLKSSPGKGILFTKGDNLDINGYTDADWAGSVQDRRSTSGYFTFVGGNLVTWRSKKQEVVARSSAEAEYRGMAKAICEMLWIRNLMQDLHIKQVSPMKLYCDNKAACDIAHNPVQHDRTKHVEVDRHFIKEKLEEKLIEVPHVRSQDQLADVLTKAVSNQAFNGCLDKLGMSDIYAPT